MEEEREKKGRICVTGGTGYLGSWTVKRLLQDGYSVNATVRMDPEGKRDISYLTSLPGASERLQIFDADLDRPDSFAPAIGGCVGVFHVAHPLDFDEKEAEEVKVKRTTSGTLGILQACLDSSTVRRVVYTSTVGTILFNDKAVGSDSPADEDSWTDLDFIRRLESFSGPYVVTKTLTERIAMEFAEKHGLDLVVVAPSWIHGPFICPRFPDSVYICMALILGEEKFYASMTKTSLVHVDDVARAHIHLFEYPKAKGRYICSATDITIAKLHEFLSTAYLQYDIPTIDVCSSSKGSAAMSFPWPSSKKLLGTGFKYEKGLEEMYDGAIKSCKEKGFL